MRLISQDETYDFPYEHVVVYRNETSVVCGIMPDIREKVLLGKYNSKAKALKVMEMLREEYDYVRTFETICNGSSNYPNLPSYIFQFPKHEEIEV